MERSRFLLSITLLLVHHSSICTVGATQTNITADQSALLALKSHITSDPHNILVNWSTTTSVCNWVGITCGARHLRVASLNLSYMSFTGTIPPHLGNLSFLVALSFKNNSFHGSLPHELSYLCHLKLISFRFNNFMGSIPSWFGSFPKLQSFDLYGNQFSGTIPSTIFNLSTLQYINLSANKLSEIPNEISNLDHVEELYVQYNALKGPVPVVVFNMSSLTTLNLYGNNLSGGLPDNICQHLPSLQILNFGRNHFDGPLPSKLWQCRKLLFLNLEENNFSGSIPKNIGNLTMMKEISLSINNLTVLSLSQNQLSGSLPANLGLGLPNLQILHLSEAGLSGVIPNFSNASMLTRLELGQNSFTGFIPGTLCALTNLQWLKLDNNNLTIDTSTPEANTLSCLVNLRSLTILALAANPLNARLDDSFRNCSTSSLQYIYLYYCNMRGDIPIGIGNLSSLVMLSMRGNQLSGSIPASLRRLGNLQALFLTDNKLRGYIPYQLCQLDNLAYLFLSSNQLYGSIPSCLGNLTASLRYLSLASNSLSSTIPSTFWRLAYILYVNLSSNYLIGHLSQDIGNLKVVTEVDLSNNNLSGILPSTIGGLRDLVNLPLANNNLEGHIPSSFDGLLSLQLLDLSRNNLSGVIPKSLEALLLLKYMDVSFNRLQGEIPTGGPFQNFSAQSFVSNKALCGAARLQVPPCKNGTLEPNWRKAKYIIPGIISVILCGLCIYLCTTKRNVEVAEEATSLPQLLWRRVSHVELLRGTNGFNENNLLGSGGFGSVYKGTLSDGIDVAVKVFSLQIEGVFKSFDRECEMLSNIRHRNLIKIISCCSEIDFKALVLDYMPNGSLEKWLYSQNSLNILQRLNVMIDAASALEYLHHGYSIPIVHCDMKPSNILLDDDMVAHVADFGIAKLLDGGDSITQTMTLATIGYMAPEYGLEGMVSTRGDVYSFGILVMETFTRRKPTDEMFGGEMNIKQWIAKSLVLPDAKIDEVVDANLLGIGTEQEDDDHVRKRDCMSAIMRLALTCCAESPEGRISMKEVVATLNKIKTKFLKDAAAGRRGVLLNRPLVQQRFN
ncbi:LOW QUALITY PROTEIN: hypothetical protein PRUPE_6G160800 [Prunus persica]|uniref:non-specific serine/threonine protein kinase n=1 Tax=Prunus persica TaxID=3760 RepID=A0A251NTZ3_PRUPE|nr:LOW QUALITY PROTEIN: hypothetical protein PRUPE_6G160800 [Prunus persica]